MDDYKYESPTIRSGPFAKYNGMRVNYLGTQKLPQGGDTQGLPQDAELKPPGRTYPSIPQPTRPAMGPSTPSMQIRRPTLVSAPQLPSQDVEYSPLPFYDQRRPSNRDTRFNNYFRDILGGYLGGGGLSKPLSEEYSPYRYQPSSWMDSLLSLFYGRRF